MRIQEAKKRTDPDTEHCFPLKKNENFRETFIKLFFVLRLKRI
jgi:hypothetical protein